jgi:phenylacetic acid degradation operon negative regulatory protein
MSQSDIMNGLMLSSDRTEFSMATLLFLCKPFSISETNIRTYLSRNIKNGLYSVRKEGKKAYYRPGGKLSEISSNVVNSFRIPEWSNWDNSWWGFSYSVPGNEKPLRHKIRRKLSAYRFGMQNKGFWVRPFRVEEDLESTFHSYKKIPSCRMIQFKYQDSFTYENAEIIWNLNEINAGFEAALSEIQCMEERISEMNPEKAFKVRIELGNRIIPMLSSDPLLPPVLLPENWLGREIRDVYFQQDNMLKQRAKLYIKNQPDK